MRRAYKFRLRPTKGQHQRLQACLDDHRELYNAALQERRDAYERTVRRSAGYFGADRPKMPVRYGTQSGQLKEIRVQRPEMARWSFSSEQATLRRLDKAFGAFFRRVKADQTPGYPRFKAAHRFDSVEWPADGDGCRWKPETSRVYLQGIGDVKTTAHRKVEGTVKTISVKREGRRWFLVLSCDDVPARPLAPTGNVVGIDVGIASFATTSGGHHIDNPRWGRKAASRLALSQQVLAQKKRGSNNRRAARESVAARHRKVANQRRDFHHKTARALVEDYDVICVEDLKIANMVKRARPVPDPEIPGSFLPNGQAAKSGLNLSITDAGWAQFVSILKGKAEEAGRTVIDVNPRHTSQTCSDCGHVEPGNRVSQAVFRCLACGHSAHADANAALNILRAGLAPPGAQAA
ncbi:MAG: RNA-guided endonuclease InsQ/TnpB family protein [Acidimicrobiales bacterium]|jgi:putative transposase